MSAEGYRASEQKVGLLDFDGKTRFTRSYFAGTFGSGKSKIHVPELVAADGGSDADKPSDAALFTFSPGPTFVSRTLRYTLFCAGAEVCAGARRCGRL